MVLAATRLAHAQYNVPAQASGDARMPSKNDGSIEIATDGTPKPKPEASTPIGSELGASLDFITSDPSLGGHRLKFTDVVLFRVHGLVAIGAHTEVFGGIDLLPKQPSYTNELVFQGALAGWHYRIGDALAVYARGQVGPLLERTGWWGGGESALQFRVDLAEHALFWENAVGGTYTRLWTDDPMSRAWLTELMAQSGLAVRDTKQGAFAAWLTFTFDFPLVDSGPIDSQTRVGMQLGMLLGVSKSLDLFLEYSILDRGDLEDPRTTLPILSGGFDQKRILFGFNRRFGDRRR